METTSGLTVFQKALRDRLETELKSLDKRLVNETVGGEREFYITGKIESTDLEVWIYKNGAEFTDTEDKIDSRYEAIDYDSEESLIESYMTGLLEQLKSN